VTLVDTNLLVYASFADAPEHRQARGWIESRLRERDGTVALCWPVVYAYVRLISSTRVFAANALSVRGAWSSAQAYLRQPAVRVVTAGPRHDEIAQELAHTPGLRSEDVPDVEIAALAIEHGLVLASHDHGFRRFGGLRVIDPLDDD
jgi:uncharacterized protein